MKKTILATTLQFALGASIALLAACGGGGGGGGGGGVLPVATTPATDAGTSAQADPKAVLAATAAAEEAAAFALLNEERTSCGFGVLNRNSQLDEAARGHATWLLTNNAVGHGQVVGTPAFTGAGPMARAIAAGYSPIRVEDENTSMVGRSQAADFGSFAIRTLLSAPYHLAGMVSGARDAGIWIMSTEQVEAASKLQPRIIAQFNLAYTATAGMQAGPVGEVRSYPCEGTTGAIPKLSNETPNPVAGRNLATAPVGHPIFLSGDSNKALAISSTLLQETATGNTLAMLSPVVGSADVNKVLKINEAFILPDAPLKANTEYAVAIVGTNGGTSFTKAFKFKTGSLAEATSAPR